jgi:hypothetical protein|tara:strand:- start:420 stop:602 length:183 start_codon:yes stop_codon:yes gene_type:complete
MEYSGKQVVVKGYYCGRDKEIERIPGRRGKKSDVKYHSTRIRLKHREQRQGAESLRNKLN